MEPNKFFGDDKVKLKKIKQSIIERVNKMQSIDEIDYLVLFLLINKYADFKSEKKSEELFELLLEKIFYSA